jgi:hypothetical protein
MVVPVSRVVVPGLVPDSTASIILSPSDVGLGQEMYILHHKP